MQNPSEHKTVQARILKYAEEIGWTVVPREEVEERRGVKEQERGLSSPRPSGKHGGQECPPSLFFDDLLDPKIGKSRTLRGGRLGLGLLIFRAFACQKEVSKDE
jgi:hypothetical protein